MFYLLTISVADLEMCVCVCMCVCVYEFMDWDWERAQNARGQVRVFNVHIQSKLLYRTPLMGTCTGLPGMECH